MMCLHVYQNFGHYLVLLNLFEEGQLLLWKGSSIPKLSLSRCQPIQQALAFLVEVFSLQKHQFRDLNVTFPIRNFQYVHAFIVICTAPIFINCFVGQIKEKIVNWNEKHGNNLYWQSHWLQIGIFCVFQKSIKTDDNEYHKWNHGRSEDMIIHVWGLGHQYWPAYELVLASPACSRSAYTLYPTLW